MTPAVNSPTTLDNALAAMRSATAATRVLAGGTDLMVELEVGRTRPDRIVDVWRVEALRGIALEADGVRMGALTTCAEIIGHVELVRHASGLVAAAREVGAAQIQNRATIGGNLGTASPAADLTPVLLAMGAIVRLMSERGVRDVPAREFVTGYRATARAADELIHSVWLPNLRDGQRYAFRKVGTRAAQSIAKVVVAISVVQPEETIVEVCAVAGSVAATTTVLPTMSRELVGHRPTPERVRAAARLAALQDVTPMDDVRSTAHYRQTVLARVLASLLLGT